MMPLRAKLVIGTYIAFFASVPVVLGRHSFHEIHEKNSVKQLEHFLGPPLPANDANYPCFTLDTTKTVSTMSAIDHGNANPALDPQRLGLTNDTQHFQNGTFVPPLIHNGTVILNINHFGESPPPYTFANRFWVIDEYYRPGGPVFTFDTGETEDAYLYSPWLTGADSFFRKYVQEFGGIGILWEHRYYGQSTPYAINVNTTSSQMSFLTTEQALEDFIVFAQSFKWKIGGPRAEKIPEAGLIGTIVDFNPKNSPWVHIGGSYPGVRAALLRDRYPDTIFAGMNLPGTLM